MGIMPYGYHYSGSRKGILAYFQLFLTQSCCRRRIFMNQNPNLFETVRHGSVMFPLEYYHCVFPLESVICRCIGIKNLRLHW